MRDGRGGSGALGAGLLLERLDQRVEERPPDRRALPPPHRAQSAARRARRGAEKARVGRGRGGTMSSRALEEK